MNNIEMSIEAKINNAIIIEYSIECEKCGKIKKEYNTDEFYFTKDLISNGWTVKKDKIICDKCNNNLK